jgi:transcriptional regulator with XRE-family HTH domain
MSKIGERIKEHRTRLGLTQTDLADKVGISYVQIGRYEKRGATPSAEVAQRLADALGTTADYLVSGTTDEAATAQLMDKELLTLFRAAEQLDDNDKTLIKTFLDALITKRHVQRLAV